MLIVSLAKFFNERLFRMLYSKMSASEFVDFVDFVDKDTVNVVMDLVDQLERKAVSLSSFVVEVIT